MTPGIRYEEGRWSVGPQLKTRSLSTRFLMRDHSFSEGEQRLPHSLMAILVTCVTLLLHANVVNIDNFSVFPLRLLRNARPVLTLRSLSTKEPLIDLTVNNEGIATLTMQRPPVNSINLEFLQELNGALDEVQKNKAKGLIITSVSITLILFCYTGAKYGRLRRPSSDQI